MELFEKYGEGKIIEKECQKCGHVSELRTGGVHVGEGGSIGVFCEDDEFCCPACGFTEDTEEGKCVEMYKIEKV